MWDKYSHLAVCLHMIQPHSFLLLFCLWWTQVKIHNNNPMNWSSKKGPNWIILNRTEWGLSRGFYREESHCVQLFQHFSFSLSLTISLTHKHTYTLSFTHTHTLSRAHTCTRTPTHTHFSDQQREWISGSGCCWFVFVYLLQINHNPRGMLFYSLPFSLFLSLLLAPLLFHSHTRKYIHAIIFPSYLSLSNTLTHTDLLIHPPTPTRTHKYVPNTVSIADQQTLFSSGPKNSSSETQTYWETLELELAQVRSRSYKKFSVWNITLC